MLAAAVSHLDELLDDRLAVELRRVDKVGRAHAERPVLLAVVDVDRNDLLGLAHLAALDDGETDSAETEDGDVVALLDVGRLGPANASSPSAPKGKHSEQKSATHAAP